MKVDIFEKKYGKKLRLKNIHLLFPKGKSTLIIGTSGAGKSTLIKCIIQETSFQGKITDCNKGEIAYIPQYPALNLKESAYDAIYWSARFADLFAKRKDLELRTQAYIEKVGLTYVKENPIKNLSGGQRQRVSIAKELIRGKRTLIADEIDTGLDCGVAQSLIKMLNDITHKEDMTTIVVSHNLSNMDLYDNVVVLVKDSRNVGRIAYAGNTSNVKTYFEKDTYVDILTSVNTLEEGGHGLADQYIAKFESFQAKL